MLVSYWNWKSLIGASRSTIHTFEDIIYFGFSGSFYCVFNEHMKSITVPFFFYCNSKDSLYFNWVQSTVAQVRNKTLKGNSYSKERVGGCFHLIMEETTVSSDGTTWRQAGLKQKPVSMCLLWTLTLWSQSLRHQFQHTAWHKRQHCLPRLCVKHRRGGRAGHLLIREFVVQALATPVCMSKYSWTRHWTLRRSLMHSLEYECVGMFND